MTAEAVWLPSWEMAPVVTPEREQAWSRWKDDYVQNCIQRWMGEGGATRDDLFRATAVVLHDLGQVDALPWMPLGPALRHRLGGAFGDEYLATPEAKIEYVNSLRTAETSSEAERVEYICATLNMTEQQVRRIGSAGEGTYAPDRGKGRRTALYRHRDVEGVLLYIGITKTPELRATQHQAGSPWFRFVESTEVEWFDDRDSAARAEREAIRSEGPVFNDTHNKKNRDAAITYLFSKVGAS